MFDERIAELNKVNAHKAEVAATAAQFEKRTYTVDEVQDILGISRSLAYNMVKKNLFRCVKIGGAIRISKKSFDEWLDQQV